MIILVIAAASLSHLAEKFRQCGTEIAVVESATMTAAKCTEELRLIAQDLAIARIEVELTKPKWHGDNFPQPCVTTMRREGGCNRELIRPKDYGRTARRVTG